MHVVAHGGAGDPPDEPAARQERLADAVTAVDAGADPLDAVCAVVNELERDPRFNAGVGSAVQSDGAIRTDAGVMSARAGSDGPGARDETVGAAAGMTGVVDAVDVARVVATETPHVHVGGTPALDLAAAFDVPTDEDLWTDRTRERWAEAEPPAGGPAAVLPWVRERFGNDDADGPSGRTSGPTGDHDTVGAVATDGESVAAATSTGGRWFALAGRVGDVPQVGAGFYADERGAASATGAGEAIARFGLARRAVAELDGWSPRRASDEVIEAFEAETGARAGVVIVDRNGHDGRATNAPVMQTARHREGEGRETTTI